MLSKVHRIDLAQLSVGVTIVKLGMALILLMLDTRSERGAGRNHKRLSKLINEEDAAVCPIGHP